MLKLNIVQGVKSVDVSAKSGFTASVVKGRSATSSYSPFVWLRIKPYCQNSRIWESSTGTFFAAVASNLTTMGSL